MAGSQSLHHHSGGNYSWAQEIANLLVKPSSDVVILAVVHPLGGRSNESFDTSAPLQPRAIASCLRHSRRKGDLCGSGPAEAGMARFDKYGLNKGTVFVVAL